MQLQPELSTRGRTESAAFRRGRIVASTLRGAWRPSPGAFSGSGAELSEVAPLLIRGGAGALAWCRIRDTPLRYTTSGAQLHNRYRLQAVRGALHASVIAGAIRCLCEAGIVSILGKGWAAALTYPDHALRPEGDIDLYVREDEYAAALKVLSTPHGGRFPVDLHRGLADVGGPWTEAQERSRLVRTGDTKVRIFGEEDHLRLLILHLLRHGAWRPLWLCDVASALEQRRPVFDWDYLLRGDRRTADWIACTIALAGHLLGASAAGAPDRIESRPVPPWLIRSVVRQWGALSFVPHGCRVSVRTVLRRSPWRLVDALLMRWPNGVEATMGVRGSLNNWPRLPFQVAECFRRSAAHLADLRAAT